MNSNEGTLITVNGIELYQSDIDILCEEYINTLPDSSMIYKTACFTGLLQYLYNQSIKDLPIRITNTGKAGYTYDFGLLDDIFYKIYIPICTRYGLTPTIVQFCALVKIDHNNLGDIKSGVYRTDGQKVNPEKTRTVKNWFNTCEGALLGKAVNDNGIGAIFALKANYQYRDNQTITIEQSRAALPHETPEQIAAKYADVERPELPDLN